MIFGRSRKNIVQGKIAPTFGAIDIDWVAPFNAVMVQCSINYDGAPHPDDVLTISKIDGTWAYINPTFRVFNIGQDQTPNVICNELFHLMKDQHFLVTAGNGNNLEVGFEAIFAEGG
jgi:hypothetical protein